VAQLNSASDLPVRQAGFGSFNLKSMFFVYVLYSKKYNRFYTGMSIDVLKRLKQHNLRQNKSTKAYIPWKLIYTEEFESRPEARKKEKYLKSGVGREFIKTLLISSL
jgi:putative endonuclease